MLTAIKDGALSSEQILERFDREISVVDEVYCSPKISGVKNLYVPESVQKSLQERLLFIQQSDLFKGSVNAVGLVQRLNNALNLLGRDVDKIVSSDSSDYLDIGGVLPSKDGMPFFPWSPSYTLRYSIDYEDIIPEDLWMEREIGPIDDSRGNRSVSGNGVTVFFKAKDFVQTHGLSFEKQYISDGADTVLSINSGYSFMEGFMHNSRIHLKDGRIVKVLDAGKDSSLKAVLSMTEQEIDVTPQHIRYYIEHSNLTPAHKNSIADILHELSKYPERDYHDIFNMERPRKGVFDRLRKMINQ